MALNQGNLKKKKKKKSEEDDETEVKRETESSVADSVKSYLRDIGKIPLLNKKTETTIADQISQSKSRSALKLFLVFHFFIKNLS